MRAGGEQQCEEKLGLEETTFLLTHTVPTDTMRTIGPNLYAPAVNTHTHTVDIEKSFIAGPLLSVVTLTGIDHALKAPWPLYNILVS